MRTHSIIVLYKDGPGLADDDDFQFVVYGTSKKLMCSKGKMGKVLELTCS